MLKAWRNREKSQFVNDGTTIFINSYTFVQHIDDTNQKKQARMTVVGQLLACYLYILEIHMCALSKY
ncbi:hypothetical protein B5C02_06350 [Staphylococcus pseudintermedius]|nr:hypothetical protein B5C02_06350 [Staphylococcus pseudintermedius]